MKAQILRGMILAVMLPGFPAWSQQASQSQEAAEVTESSSAATQAAPAEVQRTRPGERRDPFRTLIVERTETGPACPPAGKRALVIGQVELQGVVRGINDEWIGVVNTRMNRAFFLRENDELCNGVVTEISEEGVAFEERTTDAFGRTRTRNVVKQLPAD